MFTTSLPTHHPIQCTSRLQLSGGRASAGKDDIQDGEVEAYVDTVTHKRGAGVYPMIMSR